MVVSLWYTYIILTILELAGLIKFTRPFLSSVSKAKAAKLVRALVDLFLDMEAGTGKEVCVLILKEPQNAHKKFISA